MRAVRWAWSKAASGGEADRRMGSLRMQGFTRCDALHAKLVGEGANRKAPAPKSGASAMPSGAF